MEELIDLRTCLLSFFGPLSVFITLLGLDQLTGKTFLNGSFGAAVVIIFSLQSPAARPAHIILGQTVAGTIGILFRLFIPVQYMWLSTAFAVSITTFILKCCKLSYPPAGATAFIITQSVEPVKWTYLLFPLFIGNLIMILLAFVLVNTVHVAFRYPDKLI
jgi:CBS domain-containing membrane protein